MKFKREYVVSKEQCENGKITYKNLFKLMLNTSNEQSKSIDATTMDLIDKGYTWMIYKWRVDFYSLPLEDEKIIILTWASEFKRLNAFREFEVYNEKNEKIISASTVFLIVDIEKKKPIRIPDTLIERFGMIEEKNFDKIDRLKIQGEKISEKTIEIEKENIDINGHVNNIVYIDWILKSVDEKFREENELESLNLIYHKEIINQKNVNVSVFQGDSLFYEIKTDEINAISEINWKRKLD